MMKKMLMVAVLAVAMFAVAGCKGAGQKAAADVKCDSYTTSTAAMNGQTLWSKCTDGKTYKVECAEAAGQSKCDCLIDAKPTGKTFTGPKPFGDKPEEELIKEANQSCGWKLIKS